MSVPNRSEQVRNRGCSECSKPLAKDWRNTALLGWQTQLLVGVCPSQSARRETVGSEHPIWGRNAL